MVFYYTSSFPFTQVILHPLESAGLGYPAKIRMDNGPELTLVKMAEWAEEHSIELEFIQSIQNSYIEHFSRTCREEAMDLYLFKRLSEVQEVTDSWLIEYNEERPHDSLGNLTPAEYSIINKESGKLNFPAALKKGGLHVGGKQP